MTTGSAQKEALSPVSDDPPPKKPPKFCPWCGGEVIKRWSPNKLRWVNQRTGVRCAYVCLKCEVAIRVFKFPTEPLFVTKREALAEAQRAYDDLEASGFQWASTRERYQQGKCTCRKGAQSLVHGEPCPVHAPLKKKRSRP